MNVGQMAIRGWHPMWATNLAKLAELVDVVVVRFDNVTGSSAAKDELKKLPLSVDIFDSDKKWNNHNWREEMMRRTDPYRPELVVCLDEDEQFDVGFKKESKRFMASGDTEMVFGYVTPMLVGGKEVFKDKPFPDKPHAKAYKWKPGLTFSPYLSRAHVTNYRKRNLWYASTKIIHYALYTEDMRKHHAIGTKAKIKQNESYTS